MLALDRLDIRRRRATQREPIMGTVLELEEIAPAALRWPASLPLNAPAELYQILQ